MSTQGTYSLNSLFGCVLISLNLTIFGESMKNLFFVFFILTNMRAYSQDSSAAAKSLPATSTYLGADQASKKDPSWKFLIGRSSIEYDATTNYYSFGDRETASANGLAIGASYEFNRFFGIGGSYANFKVKRNYTSETYSYSDTVDVDHYTTFVEITPIRYGLSEFDLAAALLMGAAQNTYFTEYKTSFFYGASVTASFNKQLGINFNTKISKEVDSLNTVSLVGYY